MTATIPFQNTYPTLPERFFARAMPLAPSSPRLLAWNEELAQQLGLSSHAWSDEEKAALFSGQQVPEGAFPIALAYAGHQFGNFVSSLGDGRALLLGEIVDKRGERFDLQLKGSGPTPFSRRGDGKSALGPVVREFIVSEAMHALGIPTTRALAAVATGDTVFRPGPLPGGVFTRVASSHIRVGTFSYFAARGDREGLSVLLDYTVKRHFPDLMGVADLPLQFFRRVVSLQAELVAAWMSVGFIHGVMNTDNTSVAGITIDFGPCAFMDEFRHNMVLSSIDQQGRYSYENQPRMAQWNLARLADTLLELGFFSVDEAIPRFESELAQFSGLFEKFWLQRMGDKLGIRSVSASDFSLIALWLAQLEENQLDFTMSFRNLASLLRDEHSDLMHVQNSGMQRFLNDWKARLQDQGDVPEVVAGRMDAVNPLYIPRNHLVERAISGCLSGDVGLFQRLLRVFKNPFKSQPGCDDLTRLPEEHERVRQTFCGT